MLERCSLNVPAVYAMAIAVKCALLTLCLAASARAGEKWQPVRPDVEPVSVTATDLLDGKCDWKFVRLTGTIRDLVHDELNPQFRFFVIDSGAETVYAPTRTITESDEDLRRRLVGAEVSVAGTCDRSIPGASFRHQLRRTLYIWRTDDIRVIRPAPKDPFDVEELGDLANCRPSEIPRLGRRRASGCVLAVWGGRQALVRRRAGDVMRLEIAEGMLPAVGDFVEAVGTPESDFFRINLVRAAWRFAAAFPVADEPPVDVSARMLLTDESGRPAAKPDYHGRLVRLEGVVRSLPSGEERRLYLADGDFLVPVDASAVPNATGGLVLGCRLAVTGVCVMNVEGWRPTAVFPRIEGFTLVPRTADDIAVLAWPSWWTAGRFVLVVSVLLAALVGFFLWNASLQRLARRRGHELYRAQIAKTSSDLRIGERTRLAVELHDAISQNLTGVSLHIGAATNFIRSGSRDDAVRQLGIATAVLDSCRGELRNCIWDLRNGSLDGVNMDTAIRSALAPYVGDTHLVVRFSIRRARISDNTAHVLIQIVRELAANAIRHGKAQSVWVAGATEGRLLRFSVTDDGTGFDPAARPGIAEGHYGLQGIRERLRPFGGTLVFKPTGGGAKAVVEMTLPEEELTA